jgi:hypothetical protein
MRTKTQFRAVKEVDEQLAWQKKCLKEDREEAKEREVGRR